jgi:hypothetical protein
MRTVSDTSPISNLAIIGQLNLLREQFGTVWIPQAVYEECGRMPQASARESILQAIGGEWLKVRPVRASKHAAISLQHSL